MNSTIKQTVRSSILLVAAMLLLSGCGQDYLTAPARDSKPCLNCMKLKINGSEIVTVDDGKITGYLTVGENDIIGPVYVEFYDSKNDRLETGNGKYKLEWTIGDVSYVKLEKYGTQTEIAFSVQGKKVGNTQVKFQLMNGGDDEMQPEFESPKILIKVEEDNN